MSEPSTRNTRSKTKHNHCNEHDECAISKWTPFAPRTDEGDNNNWRNKHDEHDEQNEQNIYIEQIEQIEHNEHDEHTERTERAACNDAINMNTISTKRTIMNAMITIKTRPK